MPAPFLPRLVTLFYLALGTTATGCAAEATPLPYTAEPALAPVAFEQPLAVVAPPGETGRLFVVEKKKGIAVVSDLTTPTRQTFLDLSQSLGTNSDGELGVLALAFHPQYRSNRQFYVWYTQFTGTGKNARGTSRLARFLASESDPNVADPTSEQLLIVQPDEASNHNGGQILFGPDGYLYLSIGDEGAYNDILENSQRLTKDFFSGIIRLDVDRKPGNLPPNPHPAVQAGTYLVPKDNPFVGATRFNGETIDPARVRTEFWAVGLRNVWRMSFDASTGDLWAGDVGQNSAEEIDLIVRGGNYGWNYREALGRGPRKAPEGLTFDEPIWDYPRTEGTSVTGGFVYRGTRYPDLDGQYLFADYSTGKVWALRPDGGKRVSPDRVRQIALIPTITSFGLDPRTGDILLTCLAQGVVRLAPAGPTK